MEDKLLYYVVPTDDFNAEGRIFYKGEKYPIFERNGRSLLVAENGEFNFTHELMKQVIDAWELNIIEVPA